MRVQVGSTNRWRIPAELGSDLLGTSQAIRAIESSKGKRKTISTGDLTSTRDVGTFKGEAQGLGVPYEAKRGNYLIYRGALYIHICEVGGRGQVHPMTSGSYIFDQYCLFLF